MDYGQRPPDEAVLLLNGRFYTMDRRVPRAEAAFVRGDRFEAVGTREAAEAAAVGPVRRIDLEGRCVVPGFIDAHAHVLALGRSLGRADLRGCRGVPDLLQRVRAAAEPLEKGAWLIAQGWRREDLWRPGEVPDMRALDAATPRHPALLWSWDFHTAWVNSLALQAAGIGPEAPDPSSGRIGREPHGHRLTGILADAAVDQVQEAIPKPSKAGRREAVLAAIREAHRWGITGIHDVEGQASLDVYEELLRERKLDLRIAFYIPGEELEGALRSGLRTGEGNEVLRFGGVKLFADGSLGSRSAAMFEPYDDEPGNAGRLRLEPAELRDAVRRAAAGGIAAAIHAIGDRAVREALGAVEAAAGASAGHALRHRIEHCQHVCDEDVPRMKAAGAAASMQPCHLFGDIAAVEAALRSRGARAHRLGTLLRAGIPLALGTDAPVEDLNPFRNLYAAVTRRREDGTPAEGWHPEERIALEDAVRAYTMGSAWAAGEEGIKGSISPGKLADFAMLSEDIFRAPPEALLRTRVLLTVVGGKVVWKEEGAR